MYLIHPLMVVRLSSDGREPNSYLGQFFNSRLDHVGMLHGKRILYIRSLLELKTRPRLDPVSLFVQGLP